MKIFAHRGLVHEFPENTLLSFEKSLERGFGLELDVHRTKDGKVVVIHDSNTKRLSGQDAVVTETTLEDLQKHDFAVGVLDGKFAGQGITVPRLKETLDLFQAKAKAGTEIAIQIKDCQEEEIERLIIDVLDEFDAAYPEFDIYSKVFVFDPVTESAEKFAELQPKLKLSFSIGENSRFANEKYPTIYTYEQVKENPQFDIVWADEWVDGLYSKEFIDKCHNDGRLVYAISPELHAKTDPKHPLSESGYEKVWQDLILWNVDGICTDFPDELKKLYEQTGKN